KEEAARPAGFARITARRCKRVQGWAVTFSPFRTLASCLPLHKRPCRPLATVLPWRFWGCGSYKGSGVGPASRAGLEVSRGLGCRSARGTYREIEDPVMPRFETIDY